MPPVGHPDTAPTLPGHRQNRSGKRLVIGNSWFKAEESAGKVG